MRSKVVIAGVILILPVACMAQADSVTTPVPDTTNQKIYKAKILKKGFYKNKDEFINNAPSIIRNFTVEQKTVSDKKKKGGIMKVQYVIPDNEAPVGNNIWGFCDSTDVYVWYAGNFWKIDCIGPYPYFVYPLVNNISSMSLPMAGIAGTAGIAGMILDESLPSYEIYLMDKKGRFKRTYSEDLIELFKDESDIKYSFRAALGPDIYEPNLKRSAITREYLKKFNERLISKE